MPGKNENKTAAASKSTPPQPPKSVSPTPKKKKQDKASVAEKGKTDPSVKDTAKPPPMTDTKHEEKNIETAKQTQSQPNEDANQPQAKDKLGKRSPEQACSGKIAGMATSTMADKQKPSSPESEKGSDSTLQPKDLNFGKTVTGIMDALGLLDGKSAENVRKEYQKLLQQQHQLEEQIPLEEIKSWNENNDVMKECCKAGGEAVDPLYKWLEELGKKHPEQHSKALEEYKCRRTFVESFRSKQQVKHVTQIDVQTAPATDKKDSKEEKQEVAPTSNGPDKTDTDGQKKDNGHFRVMIPEGYQLIQAKEYEKMQYELSNQRESIEELTSRLSAIASNKLKEGNPNIADLSDKNRPTKLGEHFASLYDDEWSEALEEISKDKKEEDDEEDMESIEELLNVVRYAYKFCGEKADEQLQKIAMGMKDAVCLTAPMVEEEAKTESKSPAKSEDKIDTKIKSKKEATSDSSPPKTNPNQGAAKGQTLEQSGTVSTQSGQTPGAVGGQTAHKAGVAKPVSIPGSPSPTPSGTQPVGNKKQNRAPEEAKVKTVISETWSVALRFARSFRKETALTAVTQIKELFKGNYLNILKLDAASKFPPAIEKYIDRCVELTWLMAVQDPPMEIKLVNEGDRSDTNYFRFYQSKGKMVKQCVWPAVFLSANGGIVSKGYIIGMAPPDKSKAK